jgi:betaine lipid synthase
MASLGGNISPPESIISPQIFVAGLAGVVFFTIGFYQLSSKPTQDGSDGEPSIVKSILLFCYSCFLKPHSAAAKGGQQGALESFYAGQAGAVCLFLPRIATASSPLEKDADTMASTM